MKKTLFILICSFFFTGAASADEMVVHLKSGNSLTIQYNGDIQNISMQGPSDAIAGMNMTPSGKAVPTKRELKTPINPVNEAARETKHTNSPNKFSFKWAKPQSED